MNSNTIEISVKNMVCNRCIKVVREELMRHNIDFVRVDLGKIHFDQELSNSTKQQLATLLEREGFELLEDKNQQLVNAIKNFVIKQIREKEQQDSCLNNSEKLSNQLGMDYTQISKLFSQTEGQTIEQFTIKQKIEYVKELLVYGELTLSEISYDLGYSSPQHLSRQFKQVTGMTPTVFKSNGYRRTLDTI